jgi:hypothetical protein
MRRSSEAQNMNRREQITVFFFSLLIAFILWLVVSLGRDHTAVVPFMLKLGQVPDELALTHPLPDTIKATITTEGWKLLGLLWYPEIIDIDVNETSVNLYERIRDRLRSRDITIISTQPMELKVHLERKISKTVPVDVKYKLSFKGSYGLTDALAAQPDSITISGAQSLLKKLNSWPTSVLEKAGISEDILETLALEVPSSIFRLSTQQVIVQAQVSEFTEGEQRTRVEILGLPKSMEISFNPAIISIRYLIPIDQYTSAQKVTLFRATVAYEELLKDSSGYVSPVITTLTDTLTTKVRLVQPRRVAYFKVIP